MKSEERPFERVYTVSDWYDGPRSGFADFGGAPHAYQSIFDDGLGDWDPERRYELSPVSAEALRQALEDWAIWQRWEEAYYAGQTPIDTHPALPADRARRDEIAPVVHRALEIDPAHRRGAVGEFRVQPGAEPGTGTRVPPSRITLEVRWTPAG